MTAQANLVPNGSFELNTGCPSWHGEMNYCNDWYLPTLGSADYFNVCGSNGWGTPYTFIDYQKPFQGNAFIGLQPYYFNPPNNISYVEYVQAKLTNKLVNGRKYRLVFYASLPDNVFFTIKNFGALFSSTPITDFTMDTTIVANAQIITNQFIKDTNWTRFSGSFIAIGNEEYITLGCFERPQTNTDTMYLTNNAALESYIYIDSVSLYEMDENLNPMDSIPNNLELVLPNVFTPNNNNKNDSFPLLVNFNKMSIYNRWGELIFESKGALWDGYTFSGKPCSEGVYYYVIQTENKIYKGKVQLLR